MQADGKLLVVPAGSLDTSVANHPDAHLFVASSANWDHDLEQITHLERYPGMAWTWRRPASPLMACSRHRGTRRNCDELGLPVARGPVRDRLAGRPEAVATAAEPLARHRDRGRADDAERLHAVARTAGNPDRYRVRRLDRHRCRRHVCGWRSVLRRSKFVHALSWCRADHCRCHHAQNREIADETTDRKSTRLNSSH